MLDKFETAFGFHKFIHKSYFKYLTVEFQQLVYCDLNLQQTKNIFKCIKIFVKKC